MPLALYLCALSTLDLCSQAKQLLLFVTLILVTVYPSSIDRFVSCGHCHSKGNLVRVAGKGGSAYEARTFVGYGSGDDGSDDDDSSTSLRYYPPPVQLRVFQRFVLGCGDGAEPARPKRREQCR